MGAMWREGYGAYEADAEPLTQAEIVPTLPPVAVTRTRKNKPGAGAPTRGRFRVRIPEGVAADTPDEAFAKAWERLTQGKRPAPELITCAVRQLPTDPRRLRRDTDEAAMVMVETAEETPRE
jgi:hypothetical protein